ncbi:MAG: endonuclease [Desulfurococcaceae archaeon]
MDEDTGVLVVYFDESNCKGYAYRSSLTDELVERWFGKYYDNKLVLDLVEVAYLLSQEKVVVRTDRESINSVEELVKRYGKCFDKFFWPMLSVFKDLRDRGRRVRVVETLKFLVKDKTGDLRVVYVLEEKMSLNINSLQNIVNEAVRNNLKATLAIVSLQGELTYYDITSADLMADGR